MRPDAHAESDRTVLEPDRDGSPDTRPDRGEVNRGELTLAHSG